MCRDSLGEEELSFNLLLGIQDACGIACCSQENRKLIRFDRFHVSIGIEGVGRQSLGLEAGQFLTSAEKKEGYGEEDEGDRGRKRIVSSFGHYANTRATIDRVILSAYTSKCRSNLYGDFP